MDEEEAPPIVCTLTEPELRERRAGVLRRVRERVLEVRRLGGEPAPAGRSSPNTGSASGFELRFAADEATVAEVLELVRLESRCCAFLRFRVTLEPAGGPLLLKVTGPWGGAELLADELMRSAEASTLDRPSETE
jgi:hypothetical protein